ncbi:hypothetical protein A359_07190 [secondary endosymbiont of Ctenarytaina eucalypti]|uniref:Uncharacterized protein n=1 Tax=secondary endosymbiont of Ctenarytaina eucalypti TaxID=1199245 RepID=J3YSA5_9ENTR|nr:hypothetical protein A359_07190 [secondary endosymbiont of Ctenarytaina eucalypti]
MESGTGLSEVQYVEVIVGCDVYCQIASSSYFNHFFLWGL